MNDVVDRTVIIGPCRHCEVSVRPGEEGVNWPWIHENGWYQCWMAAPDVIQEYGLKAEPKETE